MHTHLFSDGMAQRFLVAVKGAELRGIMSYDEMELDKIGDRKTALFLIMFRFQKMMTMW